MPVKILGVLPQGLDGVVRKVLRQTLDERAQDFVIHISRPHGDVIVDVREPFEKRLKFGGGAELEIGRELQAVLSDIVDEECGPPNPS